MDNLYIYDLFKDNFNKDNFHPLKIWNSENVTNLLIDHRSSNFEMAGLEKEIAISYIKDIWDNKSKKQESLLLEIWKNMFQKAKEKINFYSKEVEPLDLININKWDVFIDIGANKLSTINYLSNKNKETKFLALDIIPQSKEFTNPEKCTYFQVSKDNRNIPLEEKSVNVINIQFVLHHVDSITTIEKILKECKRVIKIWWRLILWEESFRSSIETDITKIVDKNKKIGILTNYDLTKRFYDLPEKQRREMIIVNDRLINTENPHMQWTWQYYNWERRTKIIQDFWFKLKYDHEFGIRINGKIKQWVWFLWEFELL